MSQSSIIAATLLAGFALYLAANDRLKVYAAVLWGNTKQPLPSSSAPGFAAPGATAPGATGTGGIGSILEGIGKLPEIGSLSESAPLLLEGF